MGLQTEFTVAERDGLSYLGSEIQWHRSAGKYLGTLSAGGLAAFAGLAREALADGHVDPIDVIPLVPAAVAIVFGGTFFWVYYRRIATLKSVTQYLMAQRIADKTFRDKWWEAFLPWRKSRRTKVPEFHEK